MKLLMKCLRQVLSGVLLLLAWPLQSATAQQPDVKLSYYDETVGNVSIVVPEVYGQMAVVALSERFTLPKPEAYLDSVTIHFDSVEGEALAIFIQKDVIASINGESYHFVDISSGATLYAGEFSIAEINAERGARVTVPIPHVKVPEEFHVVVYPIQTGPQEFASKFWLLGEKRTDEAPSIRSRSGYYGSTDPNDLQNVVAGIAGGLFTSSGLPLGIDFHIDAFVDVTSSDVAINEAHASSVYPNPIERNGELHVSRSSAITSLSIRNILGSEVKRRTGNDTSVELSTTDIPKGVYTVLIETKDGVSSEKLIVR